MHRNVRKVNYLKCMIKSYYLIFSLDDWQSWILRWVKDKTQFSQTFLLKESETEKQNQNQNMKSRNHLAL